MKNVFRARQQSSWDQSWTEQARPSAVTEPANLFSILVCLGAGALGASVLALVSGTLTYIDGALAVRDERALAMAAVVGLIGVVLMWFFKAQLLEEAKGDGSALSLFINNSGLASRHFDRPVRFGPPEMHLLRQLAGTRRSPATPSQFARSSDRPPHSAW